MSALTIERPEQQAAVLPQSPRSVAETGIPFAFLAQLACKILFYAGQQRLSELAARMMLDGLIVDELLGFLRREQLCEITSASTASQRFFALTAQGRLRAEEHLRINQYCGPAPVSLAAYCERIERQAIADLTVTSADMLRAFAGVAIEPAVLDRLGAAMNSGRAIFIHGPAGAGKSFLAQHLAGLLHGDVLVPYAVLVQDQVIQVFDMNVHVAVPLPASPATVVTMPSGDRRWVRCRRPAVMCGGELSLDMLDLRFDADTRFYNAPPQVKANNGLMIIDDLGRQRIRPTELMNRWIVPMDRKLDYLALHTGDKFRIPFDVTLVFCTNLAPEQLADEAFLRRLGYKIALGPLDPGRYLQVCESVCAAMGITMSEDAINRLLERFLAEGRPLLACTPRDLLGQARDQARYLGHPVQLTPELIDWAWRNYFVVPPQHPSA